MKKLFSIFILLIIIGCNAQTYPLRTYHPRPENSYLKDTNNELQDYVGTWKYEWDGKITYIYLKKIEHKYETSINEYRDVLIGRYKVTDLNGNFLFDNTNLSDENVKIQGTRFRKQDDKYDLIYSDSEMCNRNGTILLNFTDSTKTKLQWKLMLDENIIDSDCWFYSYPQNQRPQPLPKDAIFIKQ